MNWQLRISCGAVVSFLVAASFAAPAEPRVPGPYPEGRVLENPFEATEESLRAGDRLYRSLCVTCHGDDGGGVPELDELLKTPPPSLVDGEWIYGDSDGEIFTLIHDGARGNMQSFEDRLRDQQIWHVVNYIRSLAPKETEAVEALANPVAMSDESVAAGHQRYVRHCVECHGMDGRGHTEMVEFLATLPANLRKSGLKYGTADAAVFRIVKEGTPNDMPPYNDKFTDEQVWQLVNYLKSIRK